MRHPKDAARWGMVAVVAAIPSLADAETIRLAAAATPSLQQVIDHARPGDELVLESGEFSGPITVGTSIAMRGKPEAAIRGNGQGSVVTITAEDVIFSGMTVTGAGGSLEDMNSGVFVARTAKRAIVEKNRIEGNLYGIYLHGADDSMARDNVIIGTGEGRLSETGNGVTVWNAPGARVTGNDISFGRDGIATNASKRNVFSGNRFSNLRFAIHYMYTDDSEISDNVSTGNSVGYAIMFSSRLKITGNVSDGDRDHGLLLNYANSSTITGNTVRGHMQPASRWSERGIRSQEHGVPAADDETAADTSGMRPGPEKCVFIYNANRNRLRDNRFEGCDIGIHFTAGSEGNMMSGNAFIANRNQVKYVGTRYVDWSEKGRGNYWSDNPAFDLDGDGIADNPYRPNDLIDRVLWTAPQARVLTSSPAVQVVRWAQARFPALLPGGVTDSHPLMSPPQPPREPRS
ncbi:nitrous oxide reductase family maturation protein NosD [Agrobacterium sp. SOY23]|uniref:nitrous oxide reductase family maturation protein NosD n=1 Tax=Agrobacterium sp. SOY23 TaxID=3014555 RepID=UPI0022AF4D66|nr:nitrous oxide reductase family maturation protein NosD [Agrobacterium sp. SOY23]MCZ4432975.1 nitrous oxide reductase family maturation protein NosD [Agrobacterium sp. SOY23]